MDEVFGRYNVTTATSYSGGAAYINQAKGFNVFGASLGQTVTIPSTENSNLAASYTFTHTYDTYVGLPIKDVYPASGSTSAGGLPAETVVHSYSGALDAPTGLTGAIGLKGYGYTSDVDYDAYGRVSQAVLGSSSTTGMAYLTNSWDDHTGLLTKQTVSRSLSSPATVDEHTYTYDLAGNPTRDVETRLGSTTTAETQCYGYDAVNRLTAAWTATDACAATPTNSSHAMVGDALSAASAYWTTWTYNAVGQRTTQVQHSTGGGTDTTTANTYNGNGKNQPATLTSTATTGATTSATTYGYDVAGNMTSRSTALGSQALTWNNGGKLTAVTTTAPSGTSTNSSYVYDTDGSLLTEHDGTATVLYLPGQQITVSAAGVVSSVRYYVLPGGGTAYRTGATTNYGYKISDQHGTSTLTLDYTAQIPTWRQFTPFGQTRGTAATTWADNRTFLDKPASTVTGLVSVGARFYDPDIGNFISLDPILDPARPQLLNGYSYSANNPVTNSDPTGLYPCSWAKCAKKPSDVGGDNPSNSSTSSANNQTSNGTNTTNSNTTDTGGGDSTRTTEKSHGWCHWPSWHTVAEVAVSVAVGVAVVAAVGAVCATGVGCVILAAGLAGAASGAASYGTSVALGDDEFSVSGLATATATGAAIGVATAGLGIGVNAVRSAITGGASKAAQSAATTAVAETATAAGQAAKSGAAKAIEGGLPQGLTSAQFAAAASTVRAGAGHLGDDIVVQGSRASGTARPNSDIDLAIRVSPKRFDELIKERFKSPNPGSAKERTMQRAIESGKIQAGEAGVSRVRRSLESQLGMEVDLSVIRRGGPFDNPPFIEVP